MSLAYLSYRNTLRSVLLLAGMGLSAMGCGDDDDDDSPPAKDAGMDGGEAGSGGKGGSGAAGKTAEAGKGGGGQAGKAAPPEEDAGMPDDDVDAGSEPVGNLRDVRIEMRDFTDEVGKFVQFRLLALNGEILNLAAVHSLPTEDYDFVLPDSVTAGQEDITLEVWGDTAGVMSGAYDVGMDHAWVTVLPTIPANQDVTVMLAHGAQTSPPTVEHGDAAGTLKFSLMDSGDYLNDAFELRVNESQSGRLVARQVLTVPGSEVAFEAYGVIKTGTSYRVDFWIDADKNQEYDAPPADAAWRRTVTGSATGYNGGPGATIALPGPPSTSMYVDVGF